MRDIKKDLYSPMFAQWHMEESVSPNSHNRAGTAYYFDNDNGTGCYWAYFCGNLFACNAYDMTFHKDGTVHCPHTEHLSIACFEHVGAEFTPRLVEARERSISAYVAEEGGICHERFHAGGRLKGTSITISPDYYYGYLKKRFKSIPDIRRTFEMVDGLQNFHELATLLARMRAYRGSGMAADLFYEGVVAEAVALIIERADKLARATPKNTLAISESDRDVLANTVSYICANLDKNLTCENLARRSCMGLTKFKTSFKVCFGVTPKTYITSARMEKACELLKSTDLPVSQVARKIGYSKPGAFSEAFSKHMGAPPSSLQASRYIQKAVLPERF